MTISLRPMWPDASNDEKGLWRKYSGTSSAGLGEWHRIRPMRTSYDGGRHLRCGFVLAGERSRNATYAVCLIADALRGLYAHSSRETWSGWPDRDPSGPPERDHIVVEHPRKDVVFPLPSYATVPAALLGLALSSKWDSAPAGVAP